VHDIGKNIVRSCSSATTNDVVNLGVMVPAQTILETAQREKADVIGLSGLITPVAGGNDARAREMERSGIKLPLLIGGATTSRAHTAVKIARTYSSAVVYVPGRVAQRAGSAVATNRDARTASWRKSGRLRQDREQHRQKQGPGTAAPHRRGAALGHQTAWDAYLTPRPAQTGVTATENYPLEKNSSTISTGRRSSRPGSSPVLTPRSCKILWSAKRRRKVSPEAQDMLQRVVREKWGRGERRVCRLSGAQVSRRRHRDLP